MAYASAGEARSNGWFSRRYKGREGLDRYQADQAGKLADKARREAERDAAARKRTPQEQIRRLDALLGKGVGAVRERARLNALLGK